MPIPAQAASLAPARLTVDLGAIKRNWQALDRITPTALTGAALKADAYGTGARQVAPALYEVGARFFFVATPEEGIIVRDLLPDAHVFVLNGLWPGQSRLYAQARLMPVISSLPMLEEWLRYCISQGEAYPAALQFDTGMNRLGLRLAEAGDVKAQLNASGYKPQLLMSHFACADLPGHEKNRTQLALFQSLLGQFPDIPASLANSAGLMISKRHHFQLVRPGIALYGARAIAGRPNPMAPTVKLEAQILQVREAKVSETVGYGASFSLQRDSRLAIISLGYADGLFRALSNQPNKPGSRIVIRGHKVPLVGRISMDLAAVDITDLGNNLPVPGEMATIIGKDVTVDDHADAANTIGYEILTSLKGRYARTYRDSGTDGS